MKQTILSIAAMVLAVLYSIGLLTAPPIQPASAQEAAAATGISTEYENRLFDDSFVHTVEIEMPEASWESLKASALYKEYYDCNVTIDGETFYHVGVRTKGNTTLIQSIIREWDRYSLVLNFGKFNKSQRYYGLDKVALNNNICDSSFLRDYLCYDMMRSMGVPTPLCSFVQVKLNGEVIGLYTAVESLSDSFALRNYGTQHGQLYKPEQMDIAGMITGTEKNATLRLSELSAADGTVDACQFLGVDDVTVGLQYQGEALSNYDAIWNNAVFKAGKSDKRRLVEAIRVINQEEDASSALNVDELLRYFAVNTFILNDDCYTSYAGHNYGLYEKDGRLSLVPWDYDHALGCTGAASGTSNWTDYINTPIDEPLIDTTLAERPLLNCLLSNEEWRAQYHAYLDEFIRGYIESGEFARKAEAAAAMIRPYVDVDPTSGVTGECFDAAVASDMDFVALRTASIRGQLSGEIPTTVEGQQQASETLIDCSAFVSPDSASLTELLLPKGSGLYIEDLMRTLIPQIDPLATISIIPVEDLFSLARLEGDHEEGMIDKLSKAGRIGDPEALEDAAKLLALRVAQGIGDKVLAVLVLIVALIAVRRMDRNRGPQPRREKKRYAV